MPETRAVRTSLEVGFADGALPEAFQRYRGMAHRAIPMQAEFPFEDAQFEIVMLDASVVARNAVREAHRVLKPEGRLYFIVPERTKKQAGFTLPEIYSIVRDGFNITEIQRPAWWCFGRRGRTITICATKKNWKAFKGLVREGKLPLSPFWERK